MHMSRHRLQMAGLTLMVVSHRFPFLQCNTLGTNRFNSRHRHQLRQHGHCPNIYHNLCLPLCPHGKQIPSNTFTIIRPQIQSQASYHQILHKLLLAPARSSLGSHHLGYLRFLV